MVVACKWRRVVNKLLAKDKPKKPSAATKWFQMADKLLRIHDPSYRRKRVQQRWNRLVGKMFGLGKLGDDQRKWRQILSTGPNENKSNVKGGSARVYKDNLERWKALASKMIQPGFSS